jgi:hypothetical protein
MNLQGHRFSGNSAHNNENEDEIIETAEILIDLDARMDEIHRNAIDEKSYASLFRLRPALLWKTIKNLIQPSRRLIGLFHSST